MTIKNDVKIGARVLDDNELEVLLPNYKQIDEQIAHIRSVSYEVRQQFTKIKGTKDQRKMLPEFNKDFNNVFSILGSRGSGKTSVLLTLKHNQTPFDDKIINNKNIVLPLIVPEQIGEKNDILGWLISLFDDYVKEIIKKISKNDDDELREKYYKNCVINKNNPLQKKYDALKNSYFQSSPERRDIVKQEFVGNDEFIKELEDILSADRGLMDCFQEFIVKLLEEHRNVYKSATESDEPLLFIFFDDVDLCSGRCTEVLQIILRYLSHPSIVVFIAGNYDNFAENLTLDYLRKDGLLVASNGNASIFNETFVLNNSFDNKKNDKSMQALQIRKFLSYDYLKKIIPPSLRYTMPQLTEEQKRDFSFSGDKNNENSFSLLLNKFIKYMGLKTGQPHFLYRDDIESIGEKNKSLSYYYKIFDEQPRGLINVYYFIYQFIKNEDNNMEADKKIQVIRIFLDVIIDSSQRLSGYKQEINKIINIKSDYFINYEYLEMIYERISSEKNIAINRHDCITLFILAKFFENILVLTKKAPTKNDFTSADTHGVEVLQKLLNSANITMSLYPRINDASILLAMYESLESDLTEQELGILAWDKEGDYRLKKYFSHLEKNKLLFIKAFEYGGDREWGMMVASTILKYGDIKYMPLKNTIEWIYGEIRKVIYENYDKIELVKENLIEKYLSLKLERDISVTLEERINKKLFIENTWRNSYFPQRMNKLEQLYATLLDYQNIKRINTVEEEENYVEKNWKISDIGVKYKTVVARISQLSKIIESVNQKNTWQKALEFQRIQYISHLQNSIAIETLRGDNRGIELKKFNPQNILEKHGIPRGSITTMGYLIENVTIPPSVAGRLKHYFDILEEYKLLNEYVIPELEILLEKDTRKESKTLIQYRHDTLTKILSLYNEMDMNADNDKIIAIEIESKNIDTILESVKRDILKVQYEMLWSISPKIEDKKNAIFHNIEEVFSELISVGVSSSNYVELTVEMWGSLYKISNRIREVAELIEPWIGDRIITKENLFKIVMRLRKLEEERTEFAPYNRMIRVMKPEIIKLEGLLNSAKLDTISSNTMKYSELVVQRIEDIYLDFVDVKTLAEIEKRGEKNFYDIFKRLNESWLDNENVLKLKFKDKLVEQFKELNFHA